MLFQKWAERKISFPFDINKETTETDRKNKRE